MLEDNIFLLRWSEHFKAFLKSYTQSRNGLAREMFDKCDLPIIFGICYYFSKEYWHIYDFFMIIKILNAFVFVKYFVNDFNQGIGKESRQYFITNNIFLFKNFYIFLQFSLKPTNNFRTTLTCIRPYFTFQPRLPSFATNCWKWSTKLLLMPFILFSHNL